MGIAAFVSAHLLETTEATARLRAKQAGLDFRQVELCNQFALAACRAALMLQEGEIDEDGAMAELEQFSAPEAFKLTMIHELVRKFAAMDEDVEGDSGDGKPYGYDDLLASIDLSGPQGQRAESFLVLFRGIGGMMEAGLPEREMIANLVQHAGLPEELAREVLAGFRTVKQYVKDYKRGKPFEAQIEELSGRMAYLPVVYALVLREHERGRFQI